MAYELQDYDGAAALEEKATLLEAQLQSLATPSEKNVQKRAQSWQDGENAPIKEEGNRKEGSGLEVKDKTEDNEDAEEEESIIAHEEPMTQEYSAKSSESEANDNQSAPCAKFETDKMAEGNEDNGDLSPAEEEEDQLSNSCQASSTPERDWEGDEDGQGASSPSGGDVIETSMFGSITEGEDV